MNLAVKAKRVRDLSAFLRLDKSAADDAMKAVDREFVKHEKALFAGEGSPGGSRWAPLSDAYAARKDRLFAGASKAVTARAKQLGRRAPRGAARTAALGAENKILQLTGDMKRSFSVTSDPNHIAETVGTGGTFTIRIGSRDEKAGYHLAGARPLPRRDPLAHTPEQWRGYSKVISAALVPHIVRRIKALARATS